MDNKKFKIESAPKKGDKVEIVGLDNLLLQVVDMENQLCLYDRFAENVIISCVIPEVPRYVLEDEKDEGSMISQATEALQNLLVRYRKMVDWMRKNGIDVEAVVGDGGAKTRS